MCKAKDYSEQLLEIYNNINEDFQNTYNELTQTELIQQDLLHAIEKGNFNASEGYNFAKMIHDNRVRRRQIKNELKPLQQLKSTFIDPSYQLLDKAYREVVKEDTTLTRLTQNKTYVPRVLNKPVVTPVKKTIPVNVEHDNTKTYYRKSGIEVHVINKVNDNLYYVRMGNTKHKCLIKGKDIINIDKVKLA